MPPWPPPSGPPCPPLRLAPLPPPTGPPWPPLRVVPAHLLAPPAAPAPVSPPLLAPPDAPTTRQEGPRRYNGDRAVQLVLLVGGLLLFLAGMLAGALVFGGSRGGVSSAESSVTPSTTATGVTTPPFTLPSTSTPSDPRIDLGSGVGYTTPLGYTGARVGDGVRITNGSVTYYTAVLGRGPGEDPTVAMQSYIDAAHVGYAAATYTQTMPLAADSSGAVVSDGLLVHYRVMGASADTTSGLDGVVEVRRRADGLTLVTDLSTVVQPDGTLGESLPDGTAEELLTSFLAAPATEPTATLVAPTPSRLASTRPAPVVDGLIAVGVPLGWNVIDDAPGPIQLASQEGDRFVAARLADSSDVATAQQAALAALLGVLPDGTTDGWVAAPSEPSSGSSPVSVFDTNASGTSAGAPQAGTMRLWIDTSRSEVYVAISLHAPDRVTSPLAEGFLLAPLGASISGPR